MKRFLLAVSFLVTSLPSGAPVSAQTELVQSHYFPADLEFVELRSVRSERNLTGSASLGELSEGTLFAEVGFQKYSRRTYETLPPGGLTIEIVTLKDAKAAYSLLTLLRASTPVKGPPGDFGTFEEDLVLFSQANFFVRIISGVSGNLPRRVGISVSNRIGRKDREPALVSHFPKTGYDQASLRYYLGPVSFAKYANSVAGRDLKFRDEVEIAQACYNVENQSGILSLVGFPTSQLADEYFDHLFSLMGPRATAGQRIYFKKAGPLLGLLEGNFEPRIADSILSAIEFKYSIKWIFDKSNHLTGGIWGVPRGIMGTVVRSLILTALLCGISIVAGVSLAFFRIMLRRYAPHNFLDRPERTEVIRLKIDEK